MDLFPQSYIFLMPNVKRHVTEHKKHISNNVWRITVDNDQRLTLSVYAKELNKSLSICIPCPEDDNCFKRSSMNMLEKVGERILSCFAPLNIPDDWLCDPSREQFTAYNYTIDRDIASGVSKGYWLTCKTSHLPNGIKPSFCTQAP